MSLIVIATSGTHKSCGSSWLQQLAVSHLGALKLRTYPNPLTFSVYFVKLVQAIYIGHRYATFLTYFLLSTEMAVDIVGFLCSSYVRQRWPYFTSGQWPTSGAFHMRGILVASRPRGLSSEYSRRPSPRHQHLFLKSNGILSRPQLVYGYVAELIFGKYYRHIRRESFFGLTSYIFRVFYARCDGRWVLALRNQVHQIYSSHLDGQWVSFKTFFMSS